MSDETDLLKLLRPHSNHLTSVRNWNAYAKDHNLPSAPTLIRKFESWNALKTELELGVNNKIYTKEELLSIAREHSIHVTTYQDWNEYSKEHGLPASSTFAREFESWNALKEEIELPVSSVNWRKYSKDEIEQIIKENEGKFETKDKWNEYATKNKLPVYQTIMNYFTWNEVQALANNRKSNYTKSELLEIARKHSEFFTSMQKWDVYAKEHHLPSSMNYYRRFGSWNSIRAQLFM